MRRHVIVGSFAGCAALLLSGSLALAADNWLGIWKLNTAKSKYNPGPGPKSQTLKFEKTADGIKLTTESTSADGKTTKGGYVSKWDGMDVPFSGDNPNADTASPKKVDDNTYTNTWKKAGKATVNLKATVSPDGKTLTVVQTGTDGNGRPVNSTVVFDRQ